MKQRGQPFWLACDVLCWIGVSLTFAVFGRVLGEITGAVVAEKRRRLHPGELSLAARLLVQAEAWMAYAIARRAFRLAGLKPSRVRFLLPGGVCDDTTLISRARQLVHTFDDLDARACRRAQRILRLRLHAAPVLRGAATTTAAVAAATRARPPAPGPARAAAAAAVVVTPARLFGLSRAGLHVRAPPWRLTTAHCSLPIASKRSFRGRRRLHVTPTCLAMARRATAEAARRRRPQTIRRG